MRPRIGITCSSTSSADGHEESREARELASLETAYVSAVLRAGGLPFVLPTLETVDAPEVLAALDGLILAGGGDIEPALYGAVAVPEVDGVDARRDRYEIAVVGEAARIGLPMLGICRGLQVINVARGGTLVQHVPAVTGEDHRAAERAHQPVHPVVVEAGTVLEQVLGTSCVEVNSLHHQAVDRVGDGLVIAARAHDQSVEAVTATDGAGVVGVQWHPELLLETPAGSELFDWLIEEAAQPRRGLVTPLGVDAWTLDDAPQVDVAVA